MWPHIKRKKENLGICLLPGWSWCHLFFFFLASSLGRAQGVRRMGCQPLHVSTVWNRISSLLGLDSGSIVRPSRPKYRTHQPLFLTLQTPEEPTRAPTLQRQRVLWICLAPLPGMGEKGMRAKETKELNQYSGNQRTGCPTGQALGKLGTQTSCESNFHIDGWKAGGR